MKTLLLVMLILVLFVLPSYGQSKAIDATVKQKSEEKEGLKDEMDNEGFIVIKSLDRYRIVQTFLGIDTPPERQTNGNYTVWIDPLGKQRDEEIIKVKDYREIVRVKGKLYDIQNDSLFLIKQKNGDWRQAGRGCFLFETDNLKSRCFKLNDGRIIMIRWKFDNGKLSGAKIYPSGTVINNDEVGQPVSEAQYKKYIAEKIKEPQKK